MSECETCTRTFSTDRACNQHMNATGHWAPRFKCETCTKLFLSQNAAYQHMSAVGHWTPKFHCKSCDRQFQNENNLRMHLNSQTHRGANVPCPFCKANYTSASGLTHHLERGSCPRAPQLNRETILRFIRGRDPHGVITNKQIGWHKEEEANITYSATDRAFNGFSWECYICHRGFNTINSLNSHLNSPAHKQKVYHCPNSRVKCGMQFITLAGLFNHLESEACGYTRFEKVQQQVGDVLQGRKLIAF